MSGRYRRHVQRSVLAKRLVAPRGVVGLTLLEKVLAVRLHGALLVDGVAVLAVLLPFLVSAAFIKRSCASFKFRTMRPRVAHGVAPGLAL